MRKSTHRNRVGRVLLCAAILSSPLLAQPKKTKAQSLVEATAKNHPELTGLELSSTPPATYECITIAATEAKDLGERCDKDEFKALKAHKPFVEQEADGFDVTAPLHDAKGRLVGTVGIDFRTKPGQTKAEILKRTNVVVRELESQIPSRAFLFQPAP